MRLNSTKDGSLFYMVLALLMAMILWYVVNAREQIERLVDVRLDYKGLPAGLIVLDGQIHKMQIRIRSPRELFRGIESKDISHTIDLSGVSPGLNVLPFDKATNQAFRQYKVLEVMPLRLVLDVDILSQKEVPVQVQTRRLDRLAAYTVVWTSVQPETVMLSGPESVLATIDALTIETLPDSLTENMPHRMSVPVITPPNVQTMPDIISAEYTVNIVRVPVSLERPLHLEGAATGCTSKTKKVRLRVAVPEQFATSEVYLEKIRASAMALPAESDDAEIPVHIELPEEAKLESVTPATVTLICK